MAKKKETKEIIEKIFDYTLEDLMGERFGSYSKYIIQDRAIPDARDGLKPVQRRILYSMHKERNTYDKGYRKSAKTVGDVIGNFHPHGDSSIYDAMVRMSQPWKTRLPYIDMHGNNGSIDGDSPAAYRYTEARLSKISNEMLRDIDKETVEFAPNFDDTTIEPTVLPARFPALLVYGAQGISAGYATNIPPHNLNEIVDATIYRIDHPNCTLEDLMTFVKGPDFPTGGIIEGIAGIKEAYTTGRGKIIVKSRYNIEETKTGISIIITEIPFEVNKALLVKKIDDIRIDKKIDGIIEVRDESASDVRIVIDLKKGANKDLIINYLLKNTDMQISYNFNIVAIVNKRPKLLGLQAAIDAFINHQKNVVKKRTEFDLHHAEARYHIVEGLIKCLSILDEVIKVIRASKNKSDAKNNLVETFEFTEIQAEAIVTLQLYRLTNTDVVELKEEMEKLKKIISGLNTILSSETALKNVMKKDLKEINKEYVTERITDVVEQITDIKIDTEALIPKEDVIVVITKDGYVKRVSKRSYNKDEDTLIKDGDYIIGLYDLNTMDTILLFTDKGNYLYIPVYELPEVKWKELGKHISNIIKLEAEENIITSIPVKNFDEEKYITIFTIDGMVKRTILKEFKVQRYSKPITCMKLKQGDLVKNVCIKNDENTLIVTKMGYALKYNTNEIPVTGLKTSGVKAITLKNDNLVSGLLANDEETLAIITEKNTAKRIRIKDIDTLSRARKGMRIIRDVKTNPYYINSSFIVNSKSIIGIKTNNSINNIKVTEIPFLDNLSTGTSIGKEIVNASFALCTLDEIKENIQNEEITEEELRTVDDKIMTIGDFLDNFDIDE